MECRNPSSTRDSDVNPRLLAAFYRIPLRSHKLKAIHGTVVLLDCNGARKATYLTTRRSWSLAKTSNGDAVLHGEDTVGCGWWNAHTVSEVGKGRNVLVLVFIGREPARQSDGSVNHRRCKGREENERDSDLSWSLITLRGETFVCLSFIRRHLCSRLRINERALHWLLLLRLFAENGKEGGISGVCWCRGQGRTEFLLGSTDECGAWGSRSRACGWTRMMRFYKPGLTWLRRSERVNCTLLGLLLLDCCLEETVILELEWTTT